MYIDYMLKFDSREVADSVLFVEAESIEEGSSVIVKIPKYQSIDVIGTIYQKTGVLIPGDNYPIPEFKPIQGWHVNVRNDSQASEIEQYEVTPSPDSPERVWF